MTFRGGGNLHPRHPPCEYLGKYTSRGKPKIPPADRIFMDPGHKARKNPFDNADLGFHAIGPALHIMQLNVEGLSAAKRHIIESLAEIHHIDVICLQETHVNDDKFDRLTISGFDIISYTLYAATSLMLCVCRRLHAEMSFVWADITLPTSTSHLLNTGTTQIYHQFFLILQSWLETLTAIIRTGDIRRLIWTGSPCKSGHWTTTICCCTTPSNVARSTLQGGNVTTRQTCAGS